MKVAGDNSGTLQEDAASVPRSWSDCALGTRGQTAATTRVKPEKLASPSAIGPGGADEPTLHRAADQVRSARVRIVEVALASFAVATGWGQASAEAIVAAAQPAAAPTSPATATALERTAAIVVSPGDVVTGEGSVGRDALRAVLAGITRASDIQAAIDVDVGAIAIDTGGRSAAGRVEPAATSLIGTAAIVTGDGNEIAGERGIGADADGAVTTAFPRSGVVLDAAAESVDAGGVTAASLVGAAAAPHVGAAIERAVEPEPVVGADEWGVGGHALAAIAARIARTKHGVMGRGAATHGPRQREERGSGSGEHAETLPPRATGGQHPGQTVESRIIH